MTKRIKSKYSVCKKLKNVYNNLWGLLSKDYLRSVYTKNKINMTPFGEVLNVKQSLRMFYSNIKERSFIFYMKTSTLSNSITVDKLVSILESRLDSVLFRSCLVASFNQARQLINHGFVTVNGLQVNSSSKKLKKGDIVKLNDKFVNKDIDIFIGIIRSRSLPNHLELDLNNLSIVFLWDVNLKSSYFPINTNYSDILRFFR